MLVLRRRINESVVLGDQVTLRVEEVCGDDGRRVFGGTVKLGFQLPRSIAVYRSELRAKDRKVAHTGKKAEPARPRPGRLVEIPDAEARVRIEVPQKVPVCCNGTPTVGIDSEDGLDVATRTSTAVHQIVCRKEDRITICNNITIATLGFHRFVPAGDPRRVLCS